MNTTVVKVEGSNKPPTVNYIKPDKDIELLGLPDTIHIGFGHVPNMYLRLQGGHYDLAVPKDSITEKYMKEGGDGDDEAEDEIKKPSKEQMGTEEKLKDMEVRYERLEKAYEQASNEVKSLKKKLKEAQNSINESDLNVEISEEEEFLIKNKSKGFRKTSPQCEPETKFKFTVCKDTFNKERVFNKHMEMHDKDGDWTCEDLECSFQTISKEKLMNHKRIAHLRAISEGEGGRSVGRKKEASEITCHSCNKQFVYKIDLVKHVQEMHRALNHAET